MARMVEFPVLTKQGLAERLGVSPRWVQYRMGDGMPHVLLAGRARFRPTEVDKWLKERGHWEERDG